MSATPETACPDDGLLRQFRLGRIADSEAEPVGHHLKHCPSCVARLEKLPASDALVETSPPGAGVALSTDVPATIPQVMGTNSWPAVTPRSGETDTDREAASQTPPAHTGRYRLLRLLGAGGMGTVYLAEDPELGRKVALKLPHFTGSPDVQERSRQRFLREARAAAAVRHAHVCPIYDVGEHDGTPFVVMAYIEGCSLAQRLQREGRFREPRQAVALAVQVAEGLAAVHDQGVIHRDLKPGNVLLDSSGDAYLTDFGLARWQDDAEHLTADGVVIGTPAYMAPEQISDEFGPVTPRTDGYSLGVVLYQMLTGRLPFTAREPMRLFVQVLHDSVSTPRELRPDLDPGLERIVLEAIARRPEDRFPDARQLAAALRRWLNAPASSIPVVPPLRDLPPEETLSEAIPPPRSRRRRWSWRAAGAFAGLLLIIGLASLTLPLSDRASREEPPAQVVASKKHDPSADVTHFKKLALTPPAWSGSLDVRVWKKDNLNGPGRFLGPAVLPLRAEHQVRVEAEVNPPAYLYIVWIDTAGKALPLYPWDPRWNWPAAEKPVDRLSLPSSGKNWPISAGKPGMETVLLLARQSPWPRDVNLGALLADLPQPEMQHPSSAVRFRDWQLVPHEKPRGPNLLDERLPADPVLRTQQVLRERLGMYCDFSRAVSFANAGE